MAKTAIDEAMQLLSGSPWDLIWTINAHQNECRMRFRDDGRGMTFQSVQPSGRVVPSVQQDKWSFSIQRATLVNPESLSACLLIVWDDGPGSSEIEATISPCRAHADLNGEPVVLTRRLELSLHIVPPGHKAPGLAPVYFGHQEFA